MRSGRAGVALSLPLPVLLPSLRGGESLLAGCPAAQSVHALEHLVAHPSCQSPCRAVCIPATRTPGQRRPLLSAEGYFLEVTDATSFYISKPRTRYRATPSGRRDRKGRRSSWVLECPVKQSKVHPWGRKVGAGAQATLGHTGLFSSAWQGPRSPAQPTCPSPPSARAAWPSCYFSNTKLFQCQGLSADWPLGWDHPPPPDKPRAPPSLPPVSAPELSS